MNFKHLSILTIPFLLASCGTGPSNNEQGSTPASSDSSGQTSTSQDDSSGSESSKRYINRIRFWSSPDFTNKCEEEIAVIRKGNSTEYDYPEVAPEEYIKTTTTEHFCIAKHIYKNDAQEMVVTMNYQISMKCDFLEFTLNKDKVYLAIDSNYFAISNIDSYIGYKVNELQFNTNLFCRCELAYGWEISDAQYNAAYQFTNYKSPLVLHTNPSQIVSRYSGYTFTGHKYDKAWVTNDSGYFEGHNSTNQDSAKSIGQVTYFAVGKKVVYVHDSNYVEGETTYELEDHPVSSGYTEVVEESREGFVYYNYAYTKFEYSGELKDVYNCHSGLTTSEVSNEKLEGQLTGTGFEARYCYESTELESN